MAEFSIEAADRCVKCGLCLPHCPTYAIAANEAESPRGRIAMMAALAQGTIAETPRTRLHLDHCLTCRACESVCPAHVPYGELIDASRADLRGRRRLGSRLLDLLLGSRPGRRLLQLVAGISRPIARALRPVLPAGLNRTASLMPPMRSPRLDWGDEGDALLFTGCIAQFAGAAALEASQQVGRRIGRDIPAPRRQACCGALAQHAGLPTLAAGHAERNLQAFDAGDRPIVALDSGCLTQLRDGPGLSARVREACQFFDEHWPTKLTPAPLAGVALVHVPCTQRNVLKLPRSAQALLGRIPELTVRTLEPGHGCCGAAGAYMLDHPAEADRLVAPLIQAIAGQAPDWLLTTNIGCAMHLRGALERANLSVPVLHPLELLARQLDR